MYLLVSLLVGLSFADSSLTDEQASERTEPLDFSDPTPWSEAWSSALAAPEGCWEVSGQANWSYSFGSHSKNVGSAVFVGLLDEGTWKDMLIRSTGETLERMRERTETYYPHGHLRFYPMVGKRDLDPSRVSKDENSWSGFSDKESPIQAMLLMRYLFDGVAAATSEDSVRWNGDLGSVELLQELTGAQNATMNATIEFPEGGTAPSTAAYVYPPQGVPGRKSVKLHDGSSQLQFETVDGQVFPKAEATILNFRAVGYPGTASQSIRYISWRPCGLPTETLEDPI